MNKANHIRISMQENAKQRGFIMMRNLMLSAAFFVLVVPAFATELPDDVDARKILQRALNAAGGER
ncbi:MAG: hypothetical protein ABGX22_20355, partial [Pirellulaceae bacterium]